MPAFAEEGGAAQIPGPLVRVRAGTEAEVNVRNTLRDTLQVHGLHARPQSGPVDATPLVLAPGEQRTVRIRLDAPGTYYYWGTTMRRPFNFRTREDAQLTGAIVVDDPGAGRQRDRVIVIGMWTDTIHRARTHRQRVLGVINGRSWPHTERMEHTVGDTVRWRVINASADLHPMHLHGFYFRVDSRGDGQADTVYTAGAGGMAVTESMLAGSTMSLTWVPERPGNWLFHCHIPEHIGPRGSLGLARQAGPGAAHGEADAQAHADHARGGMNGLVMGVAVRPARTTAQAAAVAGDERRMRLLIRPNEGSSAATPFYGYAIHEGGPEPIPRSGLGVGPTLDLVRGQPVRITVVNRLPEATAVHWHGIELESYFDGVPGFSGAGQRVAPLIAPGDSFEVRFTPPRAGTFIYHTHADEERQQLAGLAGALVVTEPGERRDPTIDIPILITAPTDFAEQGRSALVNGSAAPGPIDMKVGTTYRLRFIQMSVTRAALRVELWRDSTHAAWRPVAKDGADLPATEQGARPGRAFMGIGETYDVEVTPETVGDLRLEVRLGPPWPAPSALMTTLPIRVTLPESPRR
ncbi:MAG TPA: multicopper oxidase domain-containing protein [Longimicrobium sp.]|jgi:FtsP/CotA-like multicopper oxidase with cupredoxin domain